MACDALKEVDIPVLQGECGLFIWVDFREVSKMLRETFLLWGEDVYPSSSSSSPSPSDDHYRHRHNPYPYHHCHRNYRLPHPHRHLHHHDHVHIPIATTTIPITTTEIRMSSDIVATYWFNEPIKLKLDSRKVFRADELSVLWQKALAMFLSYK